MCAELIDRDEDGLRNDDPVVRCARQHLRAGLCLHQGSCFGFRLRGTYYSVLLLKTCVCWCVLVSLKVYLRYSVHCKWVRFVGVASFSEKVARRFRM